jgi:hypothetical protein
MSYAIVSVPVAALRRKARHQSEMTNQLLFGDAVRILKKKKGIWVKVRSLGDEYEGWTTTTLLQEVNEGDAKTLHPYFTAGLLNQISIGGATMQLPMGCFLPNLTAGEGSFGENLFHFDGEVGVRNQTQVNDELIHSLTKRWLNTPYLWGGKTLMGVDCSGFVQVNFRMMGIELPRDAWQQAQTGENIEKLKDAQCGDLAFFDDREEIVHVGILLGDNKIIHASGKVRIDTMDKKGIINSETGKRTHSLRVIKRVR